MTKKLTPTGPFTLREAEQVGLGQHALQRMTKDGTIVRVHSGVFWDAAEFAVTSSRDRHLMVAAVLTREFDGEFVLARESAALLHRLATPRRLPDGPAKVSLYSANHRNARNAEGVQITVSPLHIGDVVVVNGVPATSIARTAVDLARGMTLPYALIALDSALSLGVTHSELTETIVRLKGWSGTKLLRKFVPFADALAESALESAARGVCLAAGLPSPGLQVPVRGASGRAYRVDLMWVEQRLVVEPDGWGKYGEDADSQRRSFHQEKDREDDLRAADFRVVRCTWNSLQKLPGVVADELRRRQRHSA